VNDSEGSFVLWSESYPIQANTAFVFSEGIVHKTEGTGFEPRLLVGPMNELAEPVGGSVTFYYPSEAHAIADTSEITQYSSYTIQSVSGYNYWRIASTSTGPSPQNVLYYVGDILTGNGTTDFYYLYPSAPCFKEGTKVLCQVDGVEIYQAIETLKVGTLVKTSHHGFKKIEVIASGTIHNPGTEDRLEDRLYKCSTANYPELTEDLYITGNHSILVDSLTKEQREQLIKHMGQIFLTDKKCRLIACVDQRAEPLASEGIFPIWHLALENENDKMNYGIYVNGGLLVETCSINTLKNRSNLVGI
jgi:hypothetical protein